MRLYERAFWFVFGAWAVGFRAQGFDRASDYVSACMHLFYTDCASGK